MALDAKGARIIQDDFNPLVGADEVELV